LNLSFEALEKTKQELRKKGLEIANKLNLKDLYARPGRIFHAGSFVDQPLTAREYLNAPLTPQEVANGPLYAFKGSRQEQVNKTLNSSLDAVDVLIDPWHYNYDGPTLANVAKSIDRGIWNSFGSTTACGGRMPQENLLDYVTTIDPFSTPYIGNPSKRTGFKPCALPGPRHYKTGFSPCPKSELTNGKEAPRMGLNSGTGNLGSDLLTGGID
jgi:hypothetical protein